MLYIRCLSRQIYKIYLNMFGSLKYCCTFEVQNNFTSVPTDLPNLIYTPSCVWLYFPNGCTLFCDSHTIGGYLCPNVFKIHKMQNNVKTVHQWEDSTIMNTPKGAQTLILPFSWDQFLFSQPFKNS